MTFCRYLYKYQRHLPLDAMTSYVAYLAAHPTFRGPRHARTLAQFAKVHKQWQEAVLDVDELRVKAEEEFNVDVPFFNKKCKGFHS